MHGHIYTGHHQRCSDDDGSETRDDDVAPDVDRHSPLAGSYLFKLLPPSSSKNTGIQDAMEKKNHIYAKVHARSYIVVEMMEASVKGG